MSDGSYSVLDSRDYIEYTVKKQKNLATISLIYVYINRINNRLMFKIKTPETMKLLTTQKKSIEEGKMEKMCQVLKYLRYF